MWDWLSVLRRIGGRALKFAKHPKQNASGNLHTVAQLHATSNTHMIVVSVLVSSRYIRSDQLLAITIQIRLESEEEKR